ncbi:MAG: ComF family protein [Clostridia bacterium]|nr:ComF family protein [Clostridia bacterium]
MNIKQTLDCVLNFFFPPRCESCDCVLEKDSLALCPDCRAAWENEKREICRHCGKPHVFCDCMIEDYRYFHLLPYHPSGFESVSRNLILHAKERASRYLIRFEAKELASLLRSRGVLSHAYVISFVPRSHTSVLEHGFDQSELLAKALAAELDFEYAPLLTHEGNTKQKTLTANARVANADESYILDADRAFYARGKRIILLDDVVTTGASMLACAKQLRRAGAAEVVLLSLARTASSTK